MNNRQKEKKTPEEQPVQDVPRINLHIQLRFFLTRPEISRPPAKKMKGYRSPYSMSGLMFQPINWALRAARIMRETAAALCPYGLTEELLRKNWMPYRSAQFPNAPDAPFTEFEKEILIYLVTGQLPEPLPGLEQRGLPLSTELRLTPQQAIQEINGLCIDQLEALQENYAYGLRGCHLRNWQPPADGSFMCEHKWALKALFKDQQRFAPEERLSPEQIVEKINGKTYQEAFDIYMTFQASVRRMP